MDIENDVCRNLGEISDKLDPNECKVKGRLAGKIGVEAPIVKQQGRSLALGEAEYTSKELDLALNKRSSNGDISEIKGNISIGETSKTKIIKSKSEKSKNIDVCSFKNNIGVSVSSVRSSKEIIKIGNQCHLQSKLVSRGQDWPGNSEMSEDDIENNIHALYDDPKEVDSSEV